MNSHKADVYQSGHPIFDSYKNGVYFESKLYYTNSKNGTNLELFLFAHEIHA